MKRIAGMIIKILIAIALKSIAELVAASAAKRQVEKSKRWRHKESVFTRC